MKRLAVILAVPALAFALAGCGYFQRHHAPKVEPIPETFAQARLSGSFDDGRWWQMFGDSTLDGLMDEAFAENLSLEQAAARLDQYRAASDVARATLSPTISAQGSVQEGEVAMSGLPTGYKPKLSAYDASATASYEVDLWGKLSARRGAAYADFLASENDLRAMILSVSSQLANSYYQAVEYRAQLALLDRTIQSYEAYLELVERRYSLGVAPSVDVYQAEIALAQARGQRALYQANLAAAEHGLSTLIGRYPQTGRVGLLDTLPRPVSEIRPGLPSELLQRRPDVRAAYQRLRAADLRWAEAVADRFPRITLTGSAGAKTDELSDLVDPDEIAWNVVAGLALPVFEGGKRKAEADRKAAAFREQAANYKQVLLTAFREVEDALVRGEKQREYVAELEKQAVSAGNSLRAATDRYVQGVSDYLPVLLAQTNFYSARRSLLTAKRELISTRVSLVTALGGGWTDEVIEQYELARKTHKEKGPK